MKSSAVNDRTCFQVLFTKACQIISDMETVKTYRLVLINKIKLQTEPTCYTAKGRSVRKLVYNSCILVSSLSSHTVAATAEAFFYTVGRAFVFRIVCISKCFHLAFVFRCLKAEIFLRRWKQLMVVRRGCVLIKGQSLFSYETLHHLIYFLNGPHLCISNLILEHLYGSRLTMFCDINCKTT
jgi:hypothetical protein